MTYKAIAEELDLQTLPLTKDWRLNEKHYGALQGLSKTHKDPKTKAVLQEVRSSYTKLPPPLSRGDERHPANDRLYSDVDETSLPSAESMECIEKRVAEFWTTQVVP